MVDKKTGLWKYVIWEGNTKFAKQLETVQLTAAKKILGCSSTASATI